MIQMMSWGTGHGEQRELSLWSPAPTSPLLFRKQLPSLPTRLPPLLAFRTTISSLAEAQVMTLSHFLGLLVTPVSQGNLGGMNLRRAILKDAPPRQAGAGGTREGVGMCLGVAAASLRLTSCLK